MFPRAKCTLGSTCGEDIASRALVLGASDLIQCWGASMSPGAPSIAEDGLLREFRWTQSHFPRAHFGAPLIAFACFNRKSGPAGSFPLLFGKAHPSNAGLV